MKGNTLHQFIGDILAMGGPEKEYLYRGNRYFLECEFDPQNKKKIRLIIFQCFGTEEIVFQCYGNSFSDCFKQYEKAPIYDGRTIYEAEQEIEVLFG